MKLFAPNTRLEHELRRPSWSRRAAGGASNLAEMWETRTTSDEPVARTDAERSHALLRPASSVLVPVDGESFAEHALPYALAVARRSGAALHLVHVHSPMKTFERSGQVFRDAADDHLIRHKRRAYLERLARQLRKLTAGPVRTELRESLSVSEGLSDATRMADLVVMATRGRHPFWGFWFGSTSYDLMRRTSAPLLLVRGSTAPADLRKEPAMKRILIPLDGSTDAERVLPMACALGSLTEADLTLLRIMPPVPEPTLMAQRERAKAMDYLRRTMETIDAEVSRVHPAVVTRRKPVADEILQQATMRRSNLIAVSPRGLGGLVRMFRRSVVNQLLQQSPCPVLVDPGLHHEERWN